MSLITSGKVKEVLTEAVKLGASSVHFSVGSLPVLRIDNKLTLLNEWEATNEEFMQEFTDLVLTEDKKKILTQRKEVMLSFELDKNLRFKVTIFYQKGSIAATLRYIPKIIPTVSSLGLNSTIAGLANLKTGLVIISGPFGSGRSTTVAALIEEINRTRKEYVITIEDPIEYIFTNKSSVIEQREVGRDTQSFLDALNYFQEEGGDIMFLEEMDDPEVIPVVLEIARGSALVFTTLGAGSVVQTIARVLDSFQSFDQERIKSLMAFSLKAVICQKLVPKIGGGLVAVQEILIVNDAIQSVILGGSLSQLDNIIQTSRTEGMISLDQSLVGLVREEKITREEAINNATNREKLESLLRS